MGLISDLNWAYKYKLKDDIERAKRTLDTYSDCNLIPYELYLKIKAELEELRNEKC